MTNGTDQWLACLVTPESRGRIILCHVGHDGLHKLRLCCRVSPRAPVHSAMRSNADLGRCENGRMHIYIMCMYIYIYIIHTYIHHSIYISSMLAYHGIYMCQSICLETEEARPSDNGVLKGSDNGVLKGFRPQLNFREHMSMACTLFPRFRKDMTPWELLWAMSTYTYMCVCVWHR